MSAARARDLLLAEGAPWSDTRAAGGAAPVCHFRTIGRAREVGQGWLSSAWSTLLACFSALGMVTAFPPIRTPTCAPTYNRTEYCISSRGVILPSNALPAVP